MKINRQKANSVSRQQRPRFKLNPYFRALLPLTLPGIALAGPQGGVVVGGSANINRPDTNTTVVDQNSHAAAINWQTFSIGSTERVDFVQPDASSVTLNRVVGGDVSNILGTMTANGRIFVVNPSGVLVGQGATVDVGGLVASTMDISNQDFMEGNYRFREVEGQQGRVENAGTITASEGGFVVLAGAEVANKGLIQARLGEVILAGGAALTLDIDGTGLVGYQIDEATLAEAGGVENLGQILAEGGRVVMSARVARDLISNVVNQEGLIRAGGVVEDGGDIILTAAGGDIRQAGTLDVAGGDDRAAGTVQILADGDIDLLGGSHIEATGASGGDVRAIAEGTLTYEQGASIDVARQDDGGDGGFVELSGHEAIRIRDLVNLGDHGRLLIDPQTITVESGEGGYGASISENQLESQLQFGGNSSVVELVAEDLVTFEAFEDGVLDGTSAGIGYGASLFVGIGESLEGVYTRGENGSIDFDAADEIRVSGTIEMLSGSSTGSVTGGNLTALVSEGFEGNNPSGITVMAAEAVSLGNLDALDILEGMPGETEDEVLSAGFVTVSSQFNHVILGDVSGGSTDLQANSVGANIVAGDIMSMGAVGVLADGGGNITLGSLTVMPSPTGVGIYSSADIRGGSVTINGDVTLNGGGGQLQSSPASTNVVDLHLEASSGDLTIDGDIEGTGERTSFMSFGESGFEDREFGGVDMDLSAFGGSIDISGSLTVTAVENGSVGLFSPNSDVAIGGPVTITVADGLNDRTTESNISSSVQGFAGLDLFAEGDVSSGDITINAFSSGVVDISGASVTIGSQESSNPSIDVAVNEGDVVEPVDESSNFETQGVESSFGLALVNVNAFGDFEEESSPGNIDLLGGVSVIGPSTGVTIFAGGQINIGGDVDVASTGYDIFGNFNGLTGFGPPPFIDEGELNWGESFVVIGGSANVETTGGREFSVGGGMGGPPEFGDVTIDGNVFVTGIGQASASIFASTLDVGDVTVDGREGFIEGQNNFGFAIINDEFYNVTTTYSDGDAEEPGAASVGLAEIQILTNGGNLDSGNIFAFGLGANIMVDDLVGGGALTTGNITALGRDNPGTTGSLQVDKDFEPFGGGEEVPSTTTFIDGNSNGIAIGHQGMAFSSVQTGSIVVSGIGSSSLGVAADQFESEQVFLAATSGAFSTDDTTVYGAAFESTLGNIAVRFGNPGGTAAEIMDLNLNAETDINLGVNVNAAGSVSFDFGGALLQEVENLLVGRLHPLSMGGPFGGGPFLDPGVTQLPDSTITAQQNIFVDFAGTGESMLNNLTLNASQTLNFEGGSSQGPSLTLAGSGSFTGGQVAVNNVDILAGGNISFQASGVDIEGPALNISNSLFESSATEGVIKLDASNGSGRLSFVDFIAPGEIEISALGLLELRGMTTAESGLLNVDTQGNLIVNLGSGFNVASAMFDAAGTTEFNGVFGEFADGVSVVSGGSAQFVNSIFAGGDEFSASSSTGALVFDEFELSADLIDLNIGTTLDVLNGSSFTSETGILSFAGNGLLDAADQDLLNFPMQLSVTAGGDLNVSDLQLSTMQIKLQAIDGALSLTQTGVDAMGGPIELLGETGVAVSGGSLIGGQIDLMSSAGTVDLSNEVALTGDAGSIDGMVGVLVDTAILEFANESSIFSADGLVDLTSTSVDVMAGPLDLEGGTGVSVSGGSLAGSQIDLSSSGGTVDLSNAVTLTGDAGSIDGSGGVSLDTAVLNFVNDLSISSDVGGVNLSGTSVDVSAGPLKTDGETGVSIDGGSLTATQLDLISLGGTVDLSNEVTLSGSTGLIDGATGVSIENGFLDFIDQLEIVSAGGVSSVGSQLLSDGSLTVASSGGALDFDATELTAPNITLGIGTTLSAVNETTFTGSSGTINFTGDGVINNDNGFLLDFPTQLTLSAGGSLQVSGVSANSGTISVTGGTVSVNSSNLSATGTLGISGASNATVIGGTLSGSQVSVSSGGVTSVSNAATSGSTVSVSGNSSTSVSGGSLSGSNQLTVSSGGTTSLSNVAASGNSINVTGNTSASVSGGSLTGNNQVSVSSSGNTTLSGGAISGSSVSVNASGNTSVSGTQLSGSGGSIAGGAGVTLGSASVNFINQATITSSSGSVNLNGSQLMSDGGTLTVDAGSALTINNSNLTSDAINLDIGTTLAVSNESTLTGNSGTINFDGDASFNGDDDAVLVLSFADLLELSAGGSLALDGVTLNASSLNLNAEGGDLSLVNSNLTVEEGDLGLTSSAGISILGGLLAANAVTLSADGQLSLSEGAQVLATNATFGSGGEMLINLADLNLSEQLVLNSNGGADILASLVQAGLIAITSGGNLGVSDSQLFGNMIELDSESALQIVNGAGLFGSIGSLVAAGDITLGDDLGATLDFSSNLQIDAGGTLTLTNAMIGDSGVVSPVAASLVTARESGGDLVELTSGNLILNNSMVSGQALRLVIVGAGDIVDGGTASTLDAGNLIVSGADNVMLGDSTVQIGTGQTPDGTGDAVLIGLLETLNLAPNAENPNAAFLVGNNLVLGNLSLAGDHLVLQANNVQLVGDLQFDSAQPLIQFLAGDLQQNVSLENVRSANLGSVNYGAVEFPAGTVIALGGSNFNGDIVVGQDGTVVPPPGTDLVLFTNGNINEVQPTSRDNGEVVLVGNNVSEQPPSPPPPTPEPPTPEPPPPQPPEPEPPAPEPPPPEPEPPAPEPPAPEPPPPEEPAPPPPPAEDPPPGTDEVDATQNEITPPPPPSGPQGSPTLAEEELIEQKTTDEAGEDSECA